MVKNILITGCCGYIGSHTCVELLKKGYHVVGIDNFINSKKNVLDHIKKITGVDILFYEGNVQDDSLLEKIFTDNIIDGVIDFAAFKDVGESITKPVEYYINNISTLLSLLQFMNKYNIKNLIFSSSATVYGQQDQMPITEDVSVGGTTNPYGTSKLFAEKILQDLYTADNRWNICILRYFNPVGAHKSGLIGEEPSGKPANLMPFIVNVALGQYKKVIIYGNDYDTVDGTGVRDYIHVVDLAKAHVKCLDKIFIKNGGIDIYNLGTGHPYSVLEIINTFEKVNQLTINYEIGERRAGDIAIAYTDPQKAQKELNWQAQYTIEDMCKDSYQFAIKNLSL